MTLAIEDFEELALGAPETVQLEFIGGRVGVRGAQDGNHGAIVMWLLKRCMRQRPELALYAGRGLKVEANGNGRVRPDGSLAPRKHFAGHGEWSEPDGVLMTVEVTANEPDADRRDRVEKRDAYAAAGIPVYLLIDRGERSVTVHFEPEGAKYRSLTSRPFGAVIEIPAPVGITLETEKLKDYDVIAGRFAETDAAIAATEAMPAPEGADADIEEVDLAAARAGIARALARADEQLE